MSEDQKNSRMKEEMQPYAVDIEPGEFLGMDDELYEIIEGKRYDCKLAPTFVHQEYWAPYISP